MAATAGGSFGCLASIQSRLMTEFEGSGLGGGQVLNEICTAPSFNDLR